MLPLLLLARNTASALGIVARNEIIPLHLYVAESGRDDDMDGLPVTGHRPPLSAREPSHHTACGQHVYRRWVLRPGWFTFNRFERRGSSTISGDRPLKTEKRRPLAFSAKGCSVYDIRLFVLEAGNVSKGRYPRLPAFFLHFEHPIFRLQARDGVVSGTLSSIHVKSLSGASDWRSDGRKARHANLQKLPSV